MPIVMAKCTNCGGNIEVDNSKGVGICKYCGTEFVVEKSINEYNITNNFSDSNVSVVGGNIENYIKICRRAISAGQLDKAEKYLEKIMEIDFENSAVSELENELDMLKIKNGEPEVITALKYAISRDYYNVDIFLKELYMCWGAAEKDSFIDIEKEEGYLYKRVRDIANYCRENNKTDYLPKICDRLMISASESVNSSNILFERLALYVDSEYYDAWVFMADKCIKKLNGEDICGSDEYIPYYIERLDIAAENIERLAQNKDEKYKAFKEKYSQIKEKYSKIKMENTKGTLNEEKKNLGFLSKLLGLFSEQ